MTLQKAVLSYIASQELSKSEEEKLKEVFNAIDNDRNGVITKDELVSAYITMGKSPEVATLDTEWAMKRIDLNQNGMIDYNEFLMANLVSEKELTMNRLKNAFDFLDLVLF